MKLSVDWMNTRMGNLTSPVLNTNIEVATPPEFNGGIAGIWSPEHLLVAAVNSCLMTTFLAVAENFKLGYEKFSSKAIGKIRKSRWKFL
jgi:organic hydroperoxide reductase OsmC/OhrA